MTEEHRSDDGPRLTTLGMVLLWGVTTTLVIALALFWAYQLWIRSASEYSTLDDVEFARFATPLFWFGIAIICLPWIMIWRRSGEHCVNLPAVIAVVCLLMSVIFVGLVMNDERTLTITVWTCEQGENPFSGRTAAIFADCEQSSLDLSLAIGTDTDRDRYTAEVGDGASLDVSELPRGYYSVRMTVTPPIDTASVVLLAETPRASRAVGRFRVDNPFSGVDRTWSQSVKLPTSADEYALLYYPSPEPALDDAAITFEFKRCLDGTPDDFDSSDCAPMSLDAPVMVEESPGMGPQVFREPVQTIEGNVVIWTNLESRAYTISPFITSDFITANHYRFLAVPEDGPQDASANELAPVADSEGEILTVDISPESGTVSYVIYVFPVS